MLVPDEPGRDVVHRVIYDELIQGVIRDESRKRYLEIIGWSRSAILLVMSSSVAAFAGLGRASARTQRFSGHAVRGELASELLINAAECHLGRHRALDTKPRSRRASGGAGYRRGAERAC